MLVSLDEEKYSLVLEYVDCRTLGKYLRDDTLTFNWENQLRYNKLSYFGRSFEKGKGCNDTGVYDLGVIFWELTSRSSPFNYETRNDQTSLMLDILSGLREEPIPNTNIKFIKLYQHKRPDIRQVISELSIIDSDNVSTIFYHEERINRK
ncbi:hypothetical protein C1646_757417 [Rhizophagus diaphanus]|nr:hypothetical protein C1646_757417 [Rhizophagus diaphanus] [Rhizophagus sp. MUCL 43196]